MCLQDRPDIGEHGLLPVSRQRRDVADAADPVDEVLMRAGLDVSKARLGPVRPEAAARDVAALMRAGPAVAVLAPRRLVLDSVHDGPDRVDPVDAAISGIPDQPEPPAGAHHPAKLGQRPLGVKPVKGLRDDDGVQAGRRERERLSDAREQRSARKTPAELRSHAGDRLHSREPRAGGDERRGELAGAGREVDDPAARPDAQVRRQPADRVRRIGRPGPVVRLGLSLEAARGDVVHLRQGPLLHLRSSRRRRLSVHYDTIPG